MRFPPRFAWLARAALLVLLIPLAAATHWLSQQLPHPDPRSYAFFDFDDGLNLVYFGHFGDGSQLHNGYEKLTGVLDLESGDFHRPRVPIRTVQNRDRAGNLITWRSTSDGAWLVESHDRKTFEVLAHRSLALPVRPDVVVNRRYVVFTTTANGGKLDVFIVDLDADRPAPRALGVEFEKYAHLLMVVRGTDGLLLGPHRNSRASASSPLSFYLLSTSSHTQPLVRRFEIRSLTFWDSVDGLLIRQSPTGKIRVTMESIDGSSGADLVNVDYMTFNIWAGRQLAPYISDGIFGNDEYDQRVFRDLRTGKNLKLKIPDSLKEWSKLLHDRTTGVTVIMSRNSGRVLVENSATGQLLREFLMPTGYSEIRWWKSGQEVLAVDAARQRARIYDALSGKLLKSIDPHAWLPFQVAGILLGLAIWCWLWRACSQRAGWRPEIDAAILSCLVLAGIIRRITASGHDDVTRPICQAAEGIFASWMIMASLWFVFGQTRLSLRWILPVLVLSVICALIQLTIGFAHERIWELLMPGALFTLFLIAAFWLFRLRGLQLERAQLPAWESTAIDQSPSPGRSSGFPIRDLFFAVATIAVAISSMKYVPIPPLALGRYAELLALPLMVFPSGAAAAFAALDQRRLRWRLATLVAGFLLALLLAIGLAWYFFSPRFDQFFYFAVRLAGATTLSTFCLLLIFRQSGWRLVWNRRRGVDPLSTTES